MDHLKKNRRCVKSHSGRRRLAVATGN